MSNSKITNEFQERANRYVKENDNLLKKYDLKSQLAINFPRRFKVPFLSKIALLIVAKQGGVLDVQVQDMRKK